MSSCHTFSSNSRGKKSYFAIKLFCFSLTKIDPVHPIYKIVLLLLLIESLTFIEYKF